MSKATVNVKLRGTPEGFYPIIVDDTQEFLLSEYISVATKAKKFLIVTDNKVLSLYSDSIKLDNAEFVSLDFNEETKTLDSYAVVLEQAQQMKLERRDAIVAFGGGIVGDVAGFCAATYLRGIDFIQVPTTLLAQVDSSVGGKVGVNTHFGKNLVGAFYQPKLVYANLDLLKTLDDRQFKTGLAEVVKYAFIEKSIEPDSSDSFFEFLALNRDAILQRDKQVLSYVVRRSCELKAAVVFKDEKETGLRAILNYGHTFAHALEKATDYKVFTHGEALAVGMKMALKLSLKLGLVDKSVCSKALNLISSFELEYPMPKTLCLSDLLDAMSLDKKVDDGKIRFVLSTGVADVNIVDEVDLADVSDVVRGFLWN